MNDYRATSRHERYTSCRNQYTAVSSTAYHGAQGDIDDQTSFPSADRDSDDIQPKDRMTSSSLAPRDGLSSRWLSSLSPASPAVAALARSGSVLHSRAKSWASNVSALNSPTTSSPEKSSNRQSKIFGDLFNGQSAPVHLGVPTSPTKEENTQFVMEYQPSLTERPNLRQQRRESAMSTKLTAIRPGKSSWFARKPSQPAPAPNISDELINMNINNELFPGGLADPLSPQAFNDLLLNATNLLQRMQTAYREKVEYISNVQPEIDAQKEEVEEAQTRSALLKSQLEDIGRQNEEQKAVNKDLLEQLSVEKVKLQEARDTAKTTIRLVRRDAAGSEAGEQTDDERQRRRKRRSAGSASDSGFESDADTASVFSAGMETPVSQRRPPFTLAPDHAGLLGLQRNTNRPSYSRGSTVSQSTAYSSLQQIPQHLGGEVSAWATVEKLRHENQMLRTQVEQMQHSLQDCIDLVEGGVTGL